MSANKTSSKTVITSLEVYDVRFPTSLESDGSDAVHVDPDYSACYVRLTTDRDAIAGCGLTFTIGRGNELVRHAVDSLRFLVEGKIVEDIQADMSSWIRHLTSESQLRWVGPEKGVIALASNAVINAFWDLWAKRERKPLWRLLADFTPEQIVALIDFRYLEDVLDRADAVELLRSRCSAEERQKREAEILKDGMRSYTTQVGWLGYPDEKIRALAKRFNEEGFDAYKLKVGVSLLDDRRRLGLLRSEVGVEAKVMVDANQKWGVREAVDWMTQLREFDITWIEEPTSPDDVLGHKAISQELNKIGIKVATGEMCQNKTMFKQFIQADALQFCQIDCGRLPGGLNDVLAVLLMCARRGVPVCPHAGGVGLCEMVQHVQAFDYIRLSGTTEDRMVEYVDHLHEHFVYPPNMKNARYFPPTNPSCGYSTEMKASSIEDYEYPNGKVWKDLERTGKYSDPSRAAKKLTY